MKKLFQNLNNNNNSTDSSLSFIPTISSISDTFNFDKTYGYNQPDSNSKQSNSSSNKEDSKKMIEESKQPFRAENIYENAFHNEFNENSNESSDSSLSSSYSDQEKLKEQIRQFAERAVIARNGLVQSSEKEANRTTPLNDSAMLERTRYTIDLSNDPDLQKYFGQEDENKAPKIREEEEVVEEKLIDIPDIITNAVVAQKPPPPPNDLLNPLSSSEQKVDLVEPKVDLAESKVNLVEPKVDKVDLVESKLNDILNRDLLSSQMDKALSINNHLFNKVGTNLPNSMSSPMINKLPIQPTTTNQESILSEFDPIADPNRDKQQQQQQQQQQQLTKSNPQLNFNNLVPRPFQANSKPNYNINLPPAQKLTNSMSTTFSQQKPSYSFNAASNSYVQLSPHQQQQQQQQSFVSSNPYAAQPFYGYNSQFGQASQAFHPVAFPQSAIRPNLLNSPAIPPQPQQQPNQFGNSTVNQNNNNQKPF